MILYNPIWFFLESDCGAEGGPQMTPIPLPGPVNSAPKYIWDLPYISI